VLKALPKVSQILRAEWPELDLCFDNGETKRFSIMPYTQFPGYRTFQTSACASLFSKAHLQAGTVVWNDELDISPDNLYLDSTHIDKALS
jgi:Protein of unknown function (DUF2442)